MNLGESEFLTTLHPDKFFARFTTHSEYNRV